MAVVYVPPSSAMPLDEAGFAGTWWYALWDRPVAPRLLPSPGDTVFLASPDGVVRWATEVDVALAVPYEHTDAFLTHMATVFGTPAGPVAGGSPAPGFGLAWSARPLRELAADVGALGIELDDWCETDRLDPAVARLLDLDPPRP